MTNTHRSSHGRATLAQRKRALSAEEVTARVIPITTAPQVFGPVIDTVDDVMNTTEVAALLRLHPVTIRLAAAAGQIPGRQIRNRWRFSRRAIEASLANQDGRAA